MRYRRVFVNSGHGGPDPGACVTFAGKRVTEAELNMEFGYELLYALEDSGKFDDILLSRWHDIGVIWKPQHRTENLELICRTANEWKADLLISVHCNHSTVASARGFEIWTSPGQTESDKLADAIVKQVKAAYPAWPMRCDFSDFDADKEAKFVVLVKSAMPAVLLECGFMSNPEDLERLMSPTFRAEMAYCVKKAILSIGG